MAQVDYRTIIGRSSQLWRGDGLHAVEASRWLTLSGLPSVDYNVVCCHGAGVIEQSITDVKAAGARSVILAAGVALGEVQLLADAGWVCIGSTPVMRLGLAGRAAALPPDIRRLGAADLPEARSVIIDAFGIDPSWAEVAVPDGLADSQHLVAWGLAGGSGLDSVLLAVTVDDTIVIWSMATRPQDHGRGFGRRLLDGVAAAAAGAGVGELALYASPAGQRLYTSAGFELVEHLQQWSRPRWVLGRA